MAPPRLKRARLVEGDEVVTAAKKVKGDVQDGGRAVIPKSKPVAVKLPAKRATTSDKPATTKSKPPAKSISSATKPAPAKPASSLPKITAKPPPKSTKPASKPLSTRPRKSKPRREKSAAKRAPRSLPPAPSNLPPPTAYQQGLISEHFLKHPNEQLWFHPHLLASPLYAYLPSGTPYLTRQCKAHARKLSQKIYVVMGGKRQNKPKGLQVPVEILELAERDEAATKDTRERNVMQKDERDRKKARRCLNGMFLRLGEKEGEEVLERAFEKRSGRVGRTGLIELPEKIRKAVVAHIRHVHTNYDKILGPSLGKGGKRAKGNDAKKFAARKKVKGKIEEIWTSYGPVKEVGDDPWKVCDVDEKVLVERGKKKEVGETVTTKKAKGKKIPVIDLDDSDDDVESFIDDDEEEFGGEDEVEEDEEDYDDESEGDDEEKDEDAMDWE